MSMKTGKRVERSNLELGDRVHHRERDDEGVVIEIVPVGLQTFVYARTDDGRVEEWSTWSLWYA